MNKLLCAVALSAPVFVQAQELTLVCKGWVPHYQSFTGSPVNASSDNDDFVIDLDLKKRTAKYSTQVGKIVTQFKEEDRSYLGNSDVGIDAGGRHVSSIGFIANRMTGRTNITYHFRENGDMKVLFSGKCVSAKPMF